MNRKDRRTKKSKEALSQKTVAPADPHWGLFTEGMQHQQAGKLAEAEKIYRQILTKNPRHAHSLHMMGLIALDLKSYEVAEELVRTAINESDIYIFHNSLGNILKAQEKLPEAFASYERAVTLKPDLADALNNMGTILFSLGRNDEALELYSGAIAADPHHASALNNMGVIFEQRRKFTEAMEYYQRAAAAQPASAEIHHNLGKAFYFLNRIEEAQTCFEQALKYKPDFLDALSNLGGLYRDHGKLENAMKCYLKIKSIKPDGYVYANIALILHDMGRIEESIAHYRHALELMPDNFEFLNNLGIIHDEMGRYEEAADYYKKALAIQPNRDKVISNLATAVKNLGQLDQAIMYFKQALAIAPNHSLLHSNLLLTAVYAPFISPEELAATARNFGEKVADPLRRQRPFANDKNPERKLRIGYVSPDFRNHAVNYFTEFLLKMHDRQKFEVFGYSCTMKEDTITERVKKEFDHWHDIRYMNDEEATDLIEKDKIDILIDIAGHTSKNRLLVFAKKPAPVQVTWLGYPATTGMKAMDYKITDIYAEPLGMTEHLNTETLWRLPEIFCCYQPNENSPAVIDHPPFEDNGYVTFGCFNNFAKVTDAVLETWAKIMAHVPDSRLLLEITGISAANFRADVEARLKRAGIPLERVLIEPRKRENQFVLYNRIDMALDPFPCNGGTTSMDTVWMGVPFVALAGEHFVSRMGVTILTNAGLPELIAKNVDEYITIASDLANDRARLKKMRHNLRDKIAASPVMNKQSFVKNMETAYREMWRKWCASEAKNIG